MIGTAALLVVILLLSLAGACSPPPGGTGQVLLLLTIDTLRADRLGVGGDPRARTPFLDRLARRGVQFSVALAPAPLTLPSHATILTGLLPPEHGARDNGLYRVREDVPSLPQALQEAGWDTAAFVGALPLASRFGLDRGFDVYGDTPTARGEGSLFVERPADHVNEEALRWLAGRASPDPLFLWVHYFDPHAPYAPPAPLARLASGDAYRGEIAFADTQAKRLTRALHESFAETRICATADHGESLGEHGEDTHGVFVYESTTRVPLVLSGPGMAAGTLDARPVPLTRIAGTLLDWAEPAASARFPAGLLSDETEEPIYVESMYPELRHGWSALRALRAGDWKVVRAPRPEIFDLASDPGEKHNLFEDPGVRDRLVESLRVLENARFDLTPPGIETPDPELEEALASLGYTAPRKRKPASDAPLPDPKDRIRIERLLARIGSALEAGNVRAARAGVSSALSVDPRNKETLIMRARIEAASGNVEQAFEVFRWCLTLPPASMDALVHYEAGRVALDAQRPELAEESFALAVAEDALNVDALFNWGVAAYRQGHWAEAAERWRRALTLDPEHPPARRWLPDVEHRIAKESGS